MESTHETTRLYRVLTPDDRGEIMIGLRNGESVRSIARRLERQASVILREIQANSTEDARYQSHWAQKRSERRRRTSRQRERISDRGVRFYVHEKLKEGWSPEQIAGRIRLEMPNKRINHETIYQYVFKKEPSLTKYLQCGRKKRKKRVHKRTKRVLIPYRTGIEERPQEINSRKENGHWEGDTAVSSQSKAALMVLQERSLGLTLLRKLPRCAPQELNIAIIERLSGLAPEMRRSITFDNGQENRHHHELHDAIGVQTFFCNPYRSWEKGSVENAVGLTRRVWPKKTDYALISEGEVATLEYRLNTRPRKRLGYLTPLEYAARVALTA